MNMIKLLLMAFAIHVTLIFTGIVDVPGTSLYTFLTNPIEWENADFLSLISDVFLTLGVSTIVVGTIVTRSDIFLFAGIAGVFLSFGLPLAELFKLISEQSSTELAVILVSPIILIYVVVCVSWWRGRA